MTSKFGPVFIAIAALLWGTDSLFRYPIADKVDSTFLVFAEHLLGIIALAIWVAWRDRATLFALGRREWGAAIVAGALGSALATTLFTASFRYVNPSVAVLLQKLQPVMVVAIAYVFLGERPRRKFFFWAAVALAAGVVLSFPEGNFDLASPGQTARAKGVALAFATAVLWAASTVSGKILLGKVSPGVATLWRYVFALIALVVMLAFPHEEIRWNVITSWPMVRAILYVSFISGTIPMAIYYVGLKRTAASVTTFVELLYPVSAVVLNTVVLGMPLSSIQLSAGVVLVVSVTMISA